MGSTAGRRLRFDGVRALMVAAALAGALWLGAQPEGRRRSPLPVRPRTARTA